MTVEPNAALAGSPLRLDGEDVNLSRVLVDGEPVSFRFESQQLVLENLPQQPFNLEIRTTCVPEKNTQLSGLYTSSGGFFTQCEALGFRRITYFLDRPDVMATYRVTLKADKLNSVCARVLARITCCKSTCAQGTWTRPNTRCIRS